MHCCRSWQQRSLQTEMLAVAVRLPPAMAQQLPPRRERRLVDSARCGRCSEGIALHYAAAALIPWSSAQLQALTYDAGYQSAEVIHVSVY